MGLDNADPEPVEVDEDAAVCVFFLLTDRSRVTSTRV